MIDFKKMQQSPPEGIRACPDEDNFMKWTCIIFGPEDTIWEGGIFQLSMEFSEQYPMKPPTVKFITNIFHPNVYKNGNICLDILQNNWSPSYSVASVLISIQLLLNDPNPLSPANGEAADLFTRNKTEYNRRVKQIVQQSIDAVEDDEDDDDDDEDDE